MVLQCSGLQPYPGVPLLGHPAVGGGRDRMTYACVASITD